MIDFKKTEFIVIGSVAVIALLSIITLVNLDSIDGAAARKWGGRPALQQDIAMDTAARPLDFTQMQTQQPASPPSCASIATNKQEEDVFKARGWCV